MFIYYEVFKKGRNKRLFEETYSKATLRKLIERQRIEQQRIRIISEQMNSFVKRCT